RRTRPSYRPWETRARVELRHPGKLVVELDFGLVGVLGHDDLRHRVEVTRALLALGQAATGQPQLAAAAGAGGHLEVHRAGERGHLHRGAPGRLPRGERQVYVQVVPRHPVEGVGLQLDVQVEVAVGPAVQALAALAREAQAVPVRHAPGDAGS